MDTTPTFQEMRDKVRAEAPHLFTRRKRATTLMLLKSMFKRAKGKR